MHVPLTYKIPKNPGPVDFEWLAEDRAWPELEMTISPEEVARWCDLYDDHHPWYTGPSPWGGPVAPNSIFYYAGQNAFPPRRDFNGVLAAIGFEALAPIFVGHTVRARTTIVDRWRRRDRVFVAYRLDIRDGETPVAVATRTWAIFARGEAAARVPERPSQPPSDETPALERLDPVALELSLDRMRAFEGPGEENGHTSVEIARRQGSPGPLAQGALVISTICRMMLARYGAGWQVGGTLDCKIIRSSYAGETVTSHGAVIEERDSRAICRVWVENERGETTVVGTASARTAPA
ncbi:MAG: hypothetical protein KatS3mg060_1490 [Dehalococcoidia bacterium]|nr:MAG: hypothetical protein KatS3mg060_1490 [Dehalococcoidia bacterium]